ncbi:MAG: type VI secretion system-associated protein TagF [Gammaproteobacteria bacterium]
MKPGAERIGYFGKLASRSDFVKAAQDVSLMGALDSWLAQVMAELPGDPRWKLHYDALAPLHFAFVGPRRKHAIAGHLIASRDQSGRRFPFLLMRTIEVQDPARFVARCPLVLDALWSQMECLGQSAVQAEDAAVALHSIGEAESRVDEASGAALSAFLSSGTVSSLGALLRACDVRALILGIGLMLQPALHGNLRDLHRSLVLPLPAHASARNAVAAFWLELITPFVGQADVELALFIATLEDKPVLVVGFGGASAHTLRALIEPQFRAEQQVDLADTGWVDEQVGVDVDVRALASYLEQPQLPLKLARELFLNTFIGVTT